MGTSNLPATTGAQSGARQMLNAALAPYTKSMANVLPKHLTPERMLSLTLVAAVKTPALLECTPESIALSVLRVAQWGLEIGTTAHLVPFKGVCTPIADWKGVAEMLLRSGHVRKVWARAVYANERFEVKYGTEDRIEHDPIIGDERGALVAVYAIAIVKGGYAEFEVMRFADVEKVRGGARSGGSDAWRLHYDEMAKKTVLRRLAKRLPQTAAIADAIDSEDGVPASPERTTRATAHLSPADEVAPMSGKPPMLSAGEYGGDDAGASVDPMRGMDPVNPYTGDDESLGLNDARPAAAGRRTAQAEGR